MADKYGYSATYQTPLGTKAIEVSGELNLSATSYAEGEIDRAFLIRCLRVHLGYQRRKVAALYHAVFTLNGKVVFPYMRKHRFEVFQTVRYVVDIEAPSLEKAQAMLDVHIAAGSVEDLEPTEVDSTDFFVGEEQG